MESQHYYSIIIPVYNRPDEVDDLLYSLTAQTNKNFEVLLVEDGSTKPCKEVAERYTEQMDIHYFVIPNGGPSGARNYGAEHSKGDYLLILDSDCILPETYIESIEEELSHEPADAFGGPDKAHPSFTPIQKAISYSMTSFFTTGGIRGGKKKLDKFYNPHHKAILRMIQMVVDNAHKEGKWAGICGELGADTELTETFVKMGIDELSVAPSMILKLRKIVREMP